MTKRIYGIREALEHQGKTGGPKGLANGLKRTPTLAPWGSYIKTLGFVACKFRKLFLN